LKRHLTALKAWNDGPAGTGFLPLVAPAGGSAVAGADASADSLPVFL